MVVMAFDEKGQADTTARHQVLHYRRRKGMDLATLPGAESGLRAPAGNGAGAWPGQAGSRLPGRARWAAWKTVSTKL